MYYSTNPSNNLIPRPEIYICTILYLSFFSSQLDIE